MANITTTEAYGFIPEIWLGQALGRLRNYLTIQKTVTRNTDLTGGGAFNVGQTLHLPKRGALTVNDKAEGSPYTVQNPTASTINLTLNKHKEVSFGIESRALSEVNQDVIAGYTEDAVVALAEQIDIDLLTFAGTMTSVNAAIVGGATLTDGNLRSARQVLVQNKVAAQTPKFGIVSPSQMNALIDPTLSGGAMVRFDGLGVTNNVSNATAGNGIRTIPGSFGKVYNFELAESQLTPFATTYKNVFYAQDAILFASRELETPDERFGVSATTMTDPESGISMRLLHGYNIAQGAHQITLDILYGYTAMRPEHMQVITTTS